MTLEEKKAVNKLCIGIDIDEVLCQMMKEYVNFLNIKFPDVKVTFNDMVWFYARKTPLFIKRWVTKEKGQQFMKELFLSADKREVVPGSKEKLQEWKQQWHSLVIITGRNPSNQHKTDVRLDTHFPQIFDKVLYSSKNTSTEMKKSDLCKQAGIQIVIEDELDNVNDIVKNWIPCSLFDKPRNQDYIPEKYPNVTKINSRDEIVLPS